MPSSFVVVSRVKPVSALETLTLALASTAPFASFTTPVIWPVAVCAIAAPVAPKTKANKAMSVTATLRLIGDVSFQLVDGLPVGERASCVIHADARRTNHRIRFGLHPSNGESLGAPLIPACSLWKPAGRDACAPRDHQ